MNLSLTWCLLATDNTEFICICIPRCYLLMKVVLNVSIEKIICNYHNYVVIVSKHTGVFIFHWVSKHHLK